MSGKGKMSFLAQFGKGRGKGITPHHLRKISIARPLLRRLMLSACVDRVAADMYPVSRAYIGRLLEGIVHDCVAMMELAGRKTIDIKDVKLALARRGEVVYGFDGPVSVLPDSTTARGKRRPNPSSGSGSAQEDDLESLDIDFDEEEE